MRRKLATTEYLKISFTDDRAKSLVKRKILERLK